MSKEVVFAALSAQRLVTMGGDLDTVVRRTCEEFEMAGEDVAIWQEADSGPTQLVAVVRGNLFGYPQVTYFKCQPRPLTPAPKQEVDEWTSC